MSGERAYARAGVDTGRSGRAVAALVEVLAGTDPGRPSRSVLASGHYASVLGIDDRTGLALATDGVGTKIVVAEALERYDTVGIDCVAMNANDVVCVGAEPIALLDYIAVEEAEPEMLAAIARGLRAGAEDAGIEVPGGELAQLPELVRGHPSPRGFDLVGTCAGLVSLERVVTGAAIEPGDVVIGLPSTGIHSNGLTLARSTLPDVSEAPPELGGRSVGEELLEPTAIYVRAVLALLADPAVEVHGLAHITGDGLLNLLRLEADVGYRIDAPLPRPPVFDLVAARGRVAPTELYEVFNMGCGFCCVVPAAHADTAVELLSAYHPGAGAIGESTDAAGVVEIPPEGLAGDRERGFRVRES
ncbi:MAG TPA: phosphoribosylformylglycinamidine cyclo-ligase [Thermoleophilaceae bacterium]|nr:phosphoribosylformylglycinamidine cyclo-ligase [Thermoleophilaceae bacterium]